MTLEQRIWLPWTQLNYSIGTGLPKW